MKALKKNNNNYQKKMIIDPVLLYLTLMVKIDKLGKNLNKN